MNLGPLRLPIAALAAVSMFCAGCGEQLVAFHEPAGATVFVDGQARGTVPFDSEFSLGRAYAVELRPSAEDLAALRGVKPDASVRGLLVLPRAASPVATFRVGAEKLAEALRSGAVVRCMESGPHGLTLLFKGSAAGIPADDEEVLGHLHTTGSTVVRQVAETAWEVTLFIVGAAVLITVLILLYADKAEPHSPGA